MNKKCVLVNCFSLSNEMRIEPVREVFDQLGYETIYLSSDYHHVKKCHAKLPSDITAIHVVGYKRNLSISRLFSHYLFSSKVYKYLCNEEPDVIYIKIPPNSLVKYIDKYKKRHNCKVIIDIFDLWPESLPLPDRLCFAISPFTKLWKNLRNRYLQCGDLVITECEMYKHMLNGIIPEITKTIYLTKKDINYEFIDSNNAKTLKLCYLGGINNLIDINMIGSVMDELSKRFNIEIDIIGDGKKREELISMAKTKKCKVRYHGVIYDESMKYNIMKSCDFGINIMKNTSQVALTLKSIEYLRAGLALISNIPFDTKQIIEQEKCGVFADNVGELVPSAIPSLRINARRTYEKYFSYDVCKSNITEVLATIDI